MHAKTLPLPFTLMHLAVDTARRLAAALFPARGEAAGGGEELMQMSDRELSDLGIGRSEIPHLVDEGARGSCAWRR